MTGYKNGVNPLAPKATGRPRPMPHTPISAHEAAITYDAKVRRLFGMGLTIAFLSLITLGFYRFWGKTQIRRYLASRISIMGDRFEYTGTGRELFLGFLIALAVLIPLGAASYGIELITAGKSAVTQFMAMGFQYAFILFLIGYATFRARRYRLSRTALRSIRFWQTGSNVGYALRMVGYLALTTATLGIARPVGDIALYRYQMQHTWFGNQKFEFDGRAGPMMGKWILSLALVPFTLGLSLIWYAAFRIRYLQSRTRYQGIGFSLAVTFGNLVRIYSIYALVMTVLFCFFYGAIFAVAMPTIVQDQAVDAQSWIQANAMVLYGVGIGAAFVVFGLIAPIVQLLMLTHRFIRLVTNRLEFIGDVDLLTIIQSAAERPQSGEGLADALDIGGGLEVGI